jgi:hypothetical protein
VLRDTLRRSARPCTGVVKLAVCTLHCTVCCVYTTYLAITRLGCSEHGTIIQSIPVIHRFLFESHDRTTGKATRVITNRWSAVTKALENVQTLAMRLMLQRTVYKHHAFASQPSESWSKPSDAGRIMNMGRHGPQQPKLQPFSSQPSAQSKPPDDGRIMYIAWTRRSRLATDGHDLPNCFTTVRQVTTCATYNSC